jgi:hypothetical protein
MESAAVVETGGTDMAHRLTSCRATPQLSPRDALLSAAISIGGSLAVASILFVWKHPIVETVALTMLPGVWLVAIQPFYLRGHSTRAKIALIGGPLVVLLAIGVVAGLIQSAT